MTQTTGHTGGVDVVLQSLTGQGSPHCPHGPTLLFERYTDGAIRRFYACSACRDRRHCSFFQWADKPLSKKKLKERQKLAKEEQKSKFTHTEYKSRLCQFRRLKKKKRVMCHDCGLLLLPSEVTAHAGHKLASPVTKLQLRRPTHLLAPLDDNKTNAQYLFSEKSLEFLLDTINRLHYTKVLCIGTPRIHEEICFQQRQKKTRLKSMLLDIDPRLEQFFHKQQFCRYNMFNHYFFRGCKCQNMYKKFLTEQPADSVVVIMDPPFGGMVEVLAHTVKTVSGDWKTANNEPEKDLPFMWVFPYFMEHRISQNLPNFTMLDYKVDYSNHRVFSSDKKSCKHGSPVRIYTNIAPASVPLPLDQYRFCPICQRYVYNQNQHCEKCNACTSKDGRSYTHCDKCQRCIKPSWAHCGRCDSCHLPDYKCNQSNVGCHICGEHSHKRKYCPNRAKVRGGTKRKQVRMTSKHGAKKPKRIQNSS